MAATKSIRDSRMRYYTVEDANRALPYVRAIVSDIVRQNGVVEELQRRLARLGHERRRGVAPDDAYAEELTQFRHELEAEEERLDTYHQELKALGVELRNMDGLCDFPSRMDGREVYLCWRLGEPSVAHWHDLEAGFAGRRPIESVVDADATPST